MTEKRSNVAMVVALAGALAAGFSWLESTSTKAGAQTELAVTSEFQLEVVQRVARLEAFHERDDEGPPEPEWPDEDEEGFVEEDPPPEIEEPAPVQRIGSPFRKPSPGSKAVQKRIREYSW